jgi:hypothetical protein
MLRRRRIGAREVPRMSGAAVYTRSHSTNAPMCAVSGQSSLTTLMTSDSDFLATAPRSTSSVVAAVVSRFLAASPDPGVPPTPGPAPSACPVETDMSARIIRQKPRQASRRRRYGIGHFREEMTCAEHYGSSPWKAFRVRPFSDAWFSADVYSK